MQPSTADLDVALAFVVERISQEAERSTTPLNEDEEYFLNHLPPQGHEPNGSGSVWIQHRLRVLLANARS